jgi:hypothetical protein
MQKIIISQPWGGLGDNLQFSTLPELYTKRGYEVYISLNNKVRNPEIFDLVWFKNPFVKGILNDNLGNVVGSNMQDKWPDVKQNEYSMHRIELAHGFSKTNFYPKIYYTPRYIKKHNNDIIIDLTGSSQVYEIHKYIEYIDYFIPIIMNNEGKKIKIITFEKINVNKIFDNVYKYLRQKISNIEELKISSLIEYCDIINSCNMIIIVNSGINSLAAAIKQDNQYPNIICYNPWNHFTPEEIKGCYNYKNIAYFQSKIN